MKCVIAVGKLQFPLPAALWLTLVFTVLSAGCATGDKIADKQREMKSQLRNLYGVSGAAFSPDSRLLAIGTGHEVLVLEVSSGNTLAHLPFSWSARFGRTRSIAFINDHQLVTAARGVIQLWDAESGSSLQKLNLRSRGQLPRAIAWSPAEKSLALTISDSSSVIQLVRLDESGFGPLQDIEGISVYPRDLLFSRDGHYLAAAGDGEGVYIHDLKSDQAAGELPTRGSVNDLELFGNRQLLVAGKDVALWSFQGEERNFEFENPGVNGQVNAQVITKVAGTVAYGVLGVLAILSGSPYTGEIIQGMIEGPGLTVANTQSSWCGRSTAISPDGSLLADVYPGISKEVIQIHDLSGTNQSRKLNPRGEFTCVARFSPDGRLLLLTTDKVVSLYDTKTWRHRDIEIH